MPKFITKDSQIISESFVNIVFVNGSIEYRRKDGSKIEADIIKDNFDLNSVAFNQISTMNKEKKQDFLKQRADTFYKKSEFALFKSRINSEK
jgi:hypothetical protein